MFGGIYLPPKIYLQIRWQNISFHTKDISSLQDISPKYIRKYIIMAKKIYLFHRFQQDSKFLEIYLAFSRYISGKIYLSSQFPNKRYLFPRYITKEIYISQRHNSVTHFLEIYLCGAKDISFSRKIISSMLR